MEETRNDSWWGMASSEVAAAFGTDAARGLSEEEARERLARFGRNEIGVSESGGRLARFFAQFKSPLILVLLAAGAATATFGHWRDSGFIFFAVFVNVALGFWQEDKAEKALAELKTYLRERTRVVRGGVEREIDAADVVPGDLLRLSQGDRVPADARIAFAIDFHADESVLTGEPMPVRKSADPVPADAPIVDRRSAVFAGTHATQGACSAIAVATDAHTEFGKIATLVSRAEERQTPLQRMVARFGVRLGFAIGALTVAVFAAGIFSGEPFSEMFLMSVAIAVSAIPEGLPVAMTVVLAIGVQRMARRKGVVRKLVAAEALGSTTVILTDKTGTLTEARMELSEIVAFKGPADAALREALSNAEARLENPDDDPRTWRASGKIMEVALVRSAGMRGVSAAEIADKSRVDWFLPFNSDRKFSVSLVRAAHGRKLVFFGAPDVLLAHAALSAAEQKEISDRIAALAAGGARVLGLAVKTAPHDAADAARAADPADLSFEALFAFRDPVRRGIADVVARVRDAGIRTIIVTGDHAGTAASVARAVGLPADGPAVIDASELAALSDDALLARLRSAGAVARVSPADKLRIARVLQSAGEIVAMTGDGVNDAPCIKQADVGIAMGSGTEVARNVADLVLLDDEYGTIADAVAEGRRILENVRKVIVYFLSSVTDELILVGGSILFGLPLPLSALQILWVNFFADSFPAVGFAFEDGDAGFERRGVRGRPRLFDPLMRFLVLAIGVPTSMFLFAAYVALSHFGFDAAKVQTFVFASFGTYTLFVALSLRSFRRSAFSMSPFSNPRLAAGVGFGMALMIAAVYFPPLARILGTVPLSAPWVGGVAAFGLLNIFLIEWAKARFLKKERAARAA